MPKTTHAAAVRLATLRAYIYYGWNRRRGARASADAPIIVAGFHGAVLGLGEGARGLAGILRLAGRKVTDWDISERLGHLRTLDSGSPDTPPDGEAILVVHLNPIELVHLVAKTRGEPFRCRRTIGYWAWELPRIPRNWRPAFRYVDEVWTPSEFTAAAVRAAAPDGMIVRVVPHVVAPTKVAPDRARFDLPDDAIVVLCAFDFRSSIARKNPFGALAAYRMAADRSTARSLLLFKTVGAASAPAAAAALQAAIGAADDVRILDESLSGEDRDRLLASCDILLSLHRAEGFGLLPAEAMAAGKPVVASGWSGNLDFMDETSAVLTPVKLIPVTDAQGVYTGNVWANPDLQFAADALAGLIDDPAARAALGARAQAKVNDKLSPSAVSAMVEAALTEHAR